MVFGRKKKELDLTELKKQAAERARKLLEEAEADLQAHEAANAPTPTLSIEEPPRMPRAPTPPAAAAQPPQVVTRAPAAVKPETPPDAVLKGLIDEFAGLFAGGLAPADAQIVGLTLRMATYRELVRIREALDRLA